MGEIDRLTVAMATRGAAPARSFTYWVRGANEFTRCVELCLVKFSEAKRSLTRSRSDV